MKKMLLATAGPAVQDVLNRGVYYSKQMASSSTKTITIILHSGIGQKKTV